MHPRTGQYVPETAQLIAQFPKVTRSESDEMEILDRYGTTVLEVARK
jgi:hypothetical protein